MSLRAPLNFKRRSETAGNAAVTENAVCTLWGSLKGAGTTQAGVIASADYRFDADYAPATHGIDPSCVAYYGTRRFLVRSVQDPDGEGMTLVIMLHEQVAGQTQAAA